MGITNDYTFLQHQSLPCVHTFANMHRCRGMRMLIGLICVCTSLCKKCFISIMHLLHYTVRICGGIRFNTLRPRQNGRHFADDIFKCIFVNENIWIPIKISLRFVPSGPINNIPALVQILAWRRPGDKPLSEPRMESLLTHICVTRPQWVDIKSQNLAWSYIC